MPRCLSHPKGAPRGEPWALRGQAVRGGRLTKLSAVPERDARVRGGAQQRDAGVVIHTRRGHPGLPVKGGEPCSGGDGVLPYTVGVRPSTGAEC